MEEMQNNSNRPVNPRRKKRSPMQIFKERYLPFIIVALARELILVFVVGSIVRGVQRNRIEKEAELAAAQESDTVEAEKAHAAPVQSAHNGQNQGDAVHDLHNETSSKRFCTLSFRTKRNFIQKALKECLFFPHAYER